MKLKIQVGDCFNMPTGRVEVMDVGEFFIKIKWSHGKEVFFSTVTPRQLLRYPRVKSETKSELFS